MKEYNPHEIEPRWQKVWAETGAHKATEDTSKPKRYVLEMFPYPSGDIHMGHVRNYTIGDVTARYYAMRGYDVLHPMGWDAFGLPAENAAIKHNSHPAKWTYANIETQKASFKRMGFSYDWDRTVVACDPEYYRWGQWIFLQMYKRGLVERRNSPVNWCPNCKTVLANEQVTEGECWRCHGAVEKRDLTQWYYKITDYAQELLDDLDQLEGWPEPVKQMQANWIGRSEGAEVDFELIPAEGKDDGQTITVFTTRPDTLFGCSFFLLAPESPLVHDLVCGTEYEAEVMALVEGAAKVSAVERAQGDREKHGAFTGRYVINPVNGEKVPVWVADYIVADYGTGAVMAVPCGDQRDFEFARKYDLPIIPIILGEDDPLYPELNGVQERKVTTVDWEKSYEAEGVLVQSGKYTGMVGGKHSPAVDAIIGDLEAQGKGKKSVQFRLRDWLISRQRYWGEPIPLVNCPKCGWVAIPESELPLRLPEVESYEPTDNGESPLAKLTDWVKTTCPCCGGPAERETDTMPQWAGSSWYFLRYCDPHNVNALAAKEALDYWMPVDWYNGGMEHTTLHLLYSRFWHKFLYDIGVVSCKEPYAKRTSHGMILGENGEKMSKSRGNVVNPDDVVAQYGADTLRMYEMFIGDFEKTAPWNTSSIKGSKRFLERVAALTDMMTPEEGYSPELEGSFHKMIKKVSEDIEGLKCNTAIAAMMSVLNEIYDKGSVTRGELMTFITLLNPFAPHLTEEINEVLGNREMLARAKWPEYDPAKCVDAAVEIAVQVSGKIKARLMIPTDSTEEAVKALVMADANVQAALAGKTVIKEIYVKGKLYNIVAK